VEVNVEKSGQSLAKVSFTVTAQEFDKEFQVGLRQAGRQMSIKGFRPGKVPTRIIEKRHGEEVKRQLKQDFLQKAYQQAIEEGELKPISHPRINIDEMQGDEQGDYKVEFDISLRPTVELPDYSNLQILMQKEVIDDDKVEAAIDDIKRSQARPEPVGEDGLAEDGMLLADISFLFGEESVFEREGLRLSPATAPPGVEPDAFKEALLGARDEDQIDVEMTLPETLDNEEARNQKGTCHIVVKQAFAMAPPSDEELFAMLEAENEQELNQKVRERLEEASVQREQTRQETELLDQLINQTELELPAPLLAEQTESRLQQLHDRLSQQGLSHEKIHEAMEEQRGTAAEEAEKGMRALLIVEALGEKENLLVTNEELDAEINSIAERNQSTVDEVRKYYSENNLGQQMAIEILERKVRTFLREGAELIAPA
jgi:trigger factor